MQPFLEAPPGRVASRRPLLLRMAPWYFAFGAFAAVFVLVTSLVGGSYTINDIPVTREAFLAATLPWVVPIGLLCAALSWGFARERLWARPTTVAAFVLLQLGTLIAAGRGAGWVAVAAASVVSVLLVTLVGWYFYRRTEVVRYYADLMARRDRASTSGIASAPQN